MKNLIIVFLFLFLLVFSVPLFAETQGGTYGGEVQGIQITITKESDLSFNVARVAGQTTYSIFNNVTSAKFLVTGDPNSTFALIVPDSITLTRQGGSQTATANLICRMSQTGYVNNTTDGSPCSASPSFGSDGKVYLTFFPNQIQFQSDVVGTYIGTLTVTVNQ